MQDSRKARRIKLATKLEAMGLDVAIITSWPNIHYFTGLSPLGALVRSWIPFPLLISSSGDIVFVCSQGFSKSMPNEYPDYQFMTFSEDELIYPHRTPFQAIRKALEALKLDTGKIRVGLELNQISALYSSEIKEAIPSASFMDIDSVVMELRYIKDAEEIAALREAARITNEVYEEVIYNHISSGMTEQDLARIFTKVIAEKGASPAFIQIFTGERTCYQNVSPTDRKIKRGDTILMDYGVKCDSGYCSDITRAAVIGKPSAAQKETSKVVKEIITSTIEYIKPERTAADIDRYAELKYKKLGSGDKYIHRTGHNLGLEPSEPFPICAANETDVVKPNMCFAIEPGIYINGVGIRLEDNIITTETGIENLTTLPYDIIAI